MNNNQKFNSTQDQITIYLNGKLLEVYKDKELLQECKQIKMEINLRSISF